MAPIPATVRLSDTADTRENYTPALMTMAVLYFMMGFITCLNDTLVPYFKRGFTLSYSESSLVQFYFFLTYGLMSIPAGKIVERIGYQRGIVSGFGVAGFGALLFFPAAGFHQYGLFLAALFIVAVGIVLLQVAANPYITVLGPARTASSRLALIQGVGSLGTTTAPLFGAYFILSSLKEASSEAVKYPYLGIAASLALIAVIVSRLRLPVLSSSDSAAPAPGKGLFSFRNFRFGLGAIFVYVGAEVSVGTFLTNYLADSLHISESDANTFVAFYWGSMLAGRVAGSFLLRSLNPSALLTGTAVAAAALILVSVSASGYVAAWTMIGVGLCNATMFAIVFSLSVEGLGEYTTRASGWLSTAIAGGAVISYAQGILKDHYSWPVAFAVPVLCYLYLVFYGLNGHRPSAR